MQRWKPEEVRELGKWLAAAALVIVIFLGWAWLRFTVLGR